MICNECGKATSLYEGTIIDGAFYCNDCIVHCHDCGKVLLKSKATFTHDGYWECDDCIDNNYMICDDCGELVRVTDVNVVNEGMTSGTRHVCNDCIDKGIYFRCMCCGNYFTASHVSIDNASDILCDDCANNYTICEECGCFVNEDDTYWMNDEPYCQDCYDELQPDNIYQRHSFNDYKIMYSELDKCKGLSGLTIGLEIEVEGDTDYATEFLDSHKDMRDMVHLECDSSVAGFEIVTQPMTKNYVNYEFRHCIDKGLDVLKKNEFKGHNSGGIHIHVANYGNLKRTMYRLKRLLYNLDSRQQELFLKLTQRTRNALDAWATNEVNYNISIEQALYQCDRYESINFDERTETLEFRMFNSNLRIERIFKNIEMVYALLDYINSNDFNSSSDLYDWMRFIYDNNVNYPNLYLFIEEKQLREKYTRPILKMYSDAV